MIQIRKFKRASKYLGCWVEPYPDYENRVNDFCKRNKVIAINTLTFGGLVTHFIVYEDEPKK